jgi:hypothetical protein
VRPAIVLLNSLDHHRDLLLSGVCTHNDHHKPYLRQPVCYR